ncbi:hypothetical protein OV208_32810 [Corallococcus sp. bb12-1]|uniref:hypothetical protein n=1 Tax=Corallococcus sp. bb12-1 TaxID=2996784 RepID=UPI00227118DC|nr:hypothetical protein [Corallococcus sp. bb12-1]MCY1046139.1 hypothetical protein [Corallococcus sp. bb12-1]
MLKPRLYIPCLAAFLGTACATGRTVTPAVPVWPLPGEFTRWEPVPGISLLAPPTSPRGTPVSPSSTVARCNPATTPDTGTWPYSGGAYFCSWSHQDLSRQFRLDWYVNTFETQALVDENLERLRLNLIQGIPGDRLTRLPAPLAGWEWREKVREWLGPEDERPTSGGELIRDRWIVVGTNLLFLQVISLEDDPFPEGEMFLDSLMLTQQAAPAPTKPR